MTNMEVLFLGTSGAVPTRERNLPSVLISFYKHMLFDAGEGTQRQMMRFSYPYGRIDAIFISHLHLDHFLGLLGLLETYQLEGRTKPLHIFAPKSLKEWLKPYRFIRFEPLREGILYEDRHFVVSAFPLDHNVRCFGFRIEEKAQYIFDEKRAKAKGIRGQLFSKLLEEGVVSIGGKEVHIEEVARLRRGRKVVYCPDTRPTERTKEEAKGADLLIHDAMYGQELEHEAKSRGHSTAMQTGSLAKSAGVKRLALFHISPRYKGPELEKEAKAVFANAFVSEDGMRIVLEKTNEFLTDFRD